MSFVQREFPLFLVAVLALHWAMPGYRAKNVVLLVASAVFYGWIHPWWVVLLVCSATLDFAMGQLIVRAKRYKRLWLGCALTANIGLLLYFKYTNFFIENIDQALTSAGVDVDLRTLHILLPAGISFYTFQTMSYTLDIYRGELKPRTSLLDYLTFVCFFPQLVAGPVERASRLLPQLERDRTFSWTDLREGFGLAMFGAFKKVVVADTLAPYVDKVFVLDAPASPLVWAATAGFAVQIYFDFSGYTDLARGTARMFGVDLVRNFDEPYLATTTPEFWQRWHMSLSRWIRDYVMTPLIGEVEHVSRVRLVAAVMVTLVVMGAWHGAGWNYVVFGVYHGVWTAVYIGLDPWVQRVKEVRGGVLGLRVFQQLGVNLLGGLIFREVSLTRVVEHLSRGPLAASEAEWRAALGLAGLVVVFSAPSWIEHVARRTVMPRLEGTAWYLPAQTWTWSAYAILIFFFHRDNARDFVYFQF